MIPSIVERILLRKQLPYIDFFNGISFYIAYKGLMQHDERLLRDSGIMRDERLYPAYRFWGRFIEEYRGGDLYDWIARDTETLFDCHGYLAEMARSDFIMGKIAHHVTGKLLDIAGGHGVRSLLIMERSLGVEATVYDRPELEGVVYKFTNGRVKFIAGDCRRSVPSGFDTMLIANFIRYLTAEECAALLKRCNTKRVIVSDVFPRRPSYLFHVLFPVVTKIPMLFDALLSLSCNLSIHSVKDVQSWMVDAGYESTKIIKTMRSPSTAIVGTRR